jgi:hypothetical protein
MAWYLCDRLLSWRKGGITWFSGSGVSRKMGV